jgi:1-phosphofructokinase
LAIITVSLSPAIDVTLATEHLHVGTHQPVKLLAQSAAGKAINVSRALAAMSIPSTATGFVGSTEADFFSRQLMTDRPGGRSIIRNRLISLDQPTRQNITILSAEGETHLRMDGFNLGELGMRRLAGEIKAVASHGDMVVMAGSVPAAISGDDAAPWRHLLKQVQATGADLVVDTSGAALQVCSREPLLVAKPNLTELSEAGGSALTFDPPAIAVAARNILPRTRHRVISCGANGALWVGDDRACWAYYDGQITVKRTVGCGDFLLAGFLAGVFTRAAPEAALCRGITSATARAMNLADPGQSLSFANLHQIAAQVETQPI